MPVPLSETEGILTAEYRLNSINNFAKILPELASHSAGIRGDVGVTRIRRWVIDTLDEAIIIPVINGILTKYPFIDIPLRMLGGNDHIFSNVFSRLNYALESKI